MPSSRNIDDAVSIFEPSAAPIPSQPITSMNRSVRWKYENASASEHEPTRAKFMNKIFGGASPNCKTPANSFRHGSSQEDDASTVEPSLVLLHMNMTPATPHFRDDLRHRLQLGHNSHNDPQDPALSALPPPPSAITKTRQTSPKIPERRKFFMDKLFTVSRYHVHEAGMPSSPGKTVLPIARSADCDSSTDANSSIGEPQLQVGKQWYRPQSITSPVLEQQNWYRPPTPPRALEEERFFVPAKLPPLLPLKRSAKVEEKEVVEKKPAVAPRRWQLYWDDWVHTATSLHCIASCSAADFRCDDTSDFRSQMGEDEDLLSMPSYYTDEDITYRGTYAMSGGGGDDSLISNNTFENDTWDERNTSSDYWSGWGSPTTTGDDATSFSSQNSAWL